MLKLSEYIRYLHQWVLVPLMLVLIYVSMMNLVSTFFLLEKYRHETIGSLEQLNDEIENTLHESELYLAKASTKHQLRLQYALLWSRLPIVQTSLHQDPNLQSIPGLAQLVEEVFKRVQSMNAAFRSEEELDPAGLRLWISALKQDEAKLTTYLVKDISARDGPYSRATWRSWLASITVVSLASLVLLLIVGRLIYVLIREQHRQRTQIEKDSLTGLASRNFIFAKLDELCKKKKDFCVVLLDLNKFKLINDTYGHQSGDQVLIYIAQNFQTSLEKIGSVGRIGGDEFIWLIPHTDRQDIAYQYNQLIQNLRRPLQFGDKQLPTSISAGAVQASSCAYTPSQILECGDAAMYWAKAIHSPSIVWYGEIDNSNTITASMV